MHAIPQERVKISCCCPWPGNVWRAVDPPNPEPTGVRGLGGPHEILKSNEEHVPLIGKFGLQVLDFASLVARSVDALSSADGDEWSLALLEIFRLSSWCSFCLCLCLCLSAGERRAALSRSGGIGGGALVVICKVQGVCAGQRRVFIFLFISPSVQIAIEVDCTHWN